MNNKILRVMFTGDSVTDCGRARPIGDGPGAIGDSYVANIFCRVWAEYPKNRIRILNTAISGNTTRDVVKRFDTDIIAYAPDYLFVMIGVNDAWRRIECHLFDEVITTNEEVEDNIRFMAKKCLENNIKPIFISPLYFETHHEIEFRKEVDDIQEIIKKVCSEYNIGYIDVQAKVDEYLRQSNTYRLSGDRVHPQAIAKTLIANCIYESPEFKEVLAFNE